MNGFSACLSFGVIGEGEISKWLRSVGFNVLPAYEKEIDNGKGPRLFTASFGELITPDMLVFGNDKIIWVEAKTKTAFTWYRISQKWQDGIDEHHWNQYCEVSKISNWPVWIFFLHRPGGVAKDTPPEREPPTGLYGNELSILETKIDHKSDKWGSSGMVYWNIDALRKIHSYPLITENERRK